MRPDRTAAYREKVAKYLVDDGVIDAKERELLEDLRNAWNISEEEAAQSEEEVRAILAIAGSMTSPPTPSPASSEMVMAQGWKKFHRPDCTWLTGGDLRTYPDRDTALAAGLVPCKTCNP